MLYYLAVGVRGGGEEEEIIMDLSQHIKLVVKVFYSYGI